MDLNKLKNKPLQNCVCKIIVKNRMNAYEFMRFFVILTKLLQHNRLSTAILLSYSEVIL